LARCCRLLRRSSIAGFLSPRFVTSPQLPSPRVVLMSYPFGIMTPIKKTGTKHRGLAPHNNTPMLGVPGPEPPIRSR
jgi:hypothetical protein